MTVRDHETPMRPRAAVATSNRGTPAWSGGEDPPPAARPDPVAALAELPPGVQGALDRLAEEVTRLRGELAAAHARLAEMERLADEDALAPIANRRAFLRELGRAIGHVGRYGSGKSLIYFDLNGMKAINDNFGHAAGDAALVQVARALKENVRSSDLVGRLGGDEFGVLLMRADEATARRKAEALALIIARTPFVWHGAAVPLSVAYGAYRVRAGVDPQVALAAADREMYRNKRAVKGGGGGAGGCDPDPDGGNGGADPAVRR
jgi:diguanylate cyclase (GGDEF)-like protein